MIKIMRLNEDSMPVDITVDGEEVVFTVNDDGDGGDFMLILDSEQLLEALAELGVLP